VDLTVSPSLEPFANLEELNFAHNMITDLWTLGLHRLPALRRLDVSHNKIDYTLPDVRGWL
jgi:Leucine-rich repeat (LRR) protein